MAVALSVLVSAVRDAAPHLAGIPDDQIASAVRTARTPAGAVWLAKRAWPAAAKTDPAKDVGRWATILRCLRPMAQAGDEAAQAILDAAEATDPGVSAALAAALAQVAQDA